MDIENQINVLLQYADVSSHITNLLVLNKTGWFVSGTLANMDIYYKQSYASRPYFITSYEQGMVCYSGLGTTRNNTIIYAYISVPIESDSGERVGVLLGSLYLNDVIQNVVDYPFEEGTLGYIVDETGIVIAHSEIDLFTLEEGPLSLNYSSHHLVYETFNGPSFSDDHYHGSVAYIGTAVMLDSNNWRVIVETPKEVILEISNALNWNLLVFNSVFFIVALSVSMILTRQITNNQKRMEGELREAKTFSESIISNALDGIVVVDLEGKFIISNEAFSRMVGCSGEELETVNFRQLTPERGMAEDEKHVNKLLQGIPITNYEKEFLRTDGSVFPVTLSISLLTDEEGKPTSMMAIIRDDTERKRMEGELLQSERARQQIEIEQEQEMNKMKTRFMSTATHELRTPLASIQGYTELVQDDQETLSEAQRQYFMVIQRNVQRLTKLTDDLLNQQRLEENRVMLNLEPVNVLDFVEEVRSDFKPILGEKHQMCEMNCIDVVVSMDRLRVMQVLVNLLSNASKFSPEGGVIVVDVVETKDGVQFSVSDQGVGIRGEDIGKLFTPFPGILVEDNVGGTGLGLSISRGIVELHGGTMWAESGGLGKGSRFSFTIPVN